MLKEKEIEKIKKWASKFYNEEQIKQMPKKEAEIMPIEQHKELENKEIAKIEKQAELEFEKILSKIENDKTTGLIEDVFYIPKNYAKMVANGNVRGLLLWGESGCGKTYSVIRAFREMKKDFVLLNGHITPLKLFIFLFQNRDKNIILDDINVFDSEINYNMLKACLSENSRLINYDTSSTKLNIPNKFVFNGTITIILNNIPKKSENLKAIQSRILSFELIMDYSTKIKIIFELARQDYRELTQEERFNIAKWIKNSTSEATENLNLRTLFTCYEFFRYDKLNWKKLAEKLLINNEELWLIIQGLSEKEFCEKTGKCRASYYNYKRCLKV